MREVAGRDIRIDAIRGVAIALIVVQHLAWAFIVHEPGPGLSPVFVGTWSDLSRLGPFWYNLMAYSAPFCVTVFAFVAGYLSVSALARPFRTFLAGRFGGIMLPFLAWTVVYALYPPATRFFVDRAGLAGFVWDSVRSPTGGIAGPVWFLQVLFISSLLTWALARLPRPKVMLALSAVVALALPRILGYLGIPVLFGAAELGAIYPYVVAGVLVRKRGSMWPRPRFWRFVAAGLVFVAAYRLMPTLAAYPLDLPAGLQSAAAAFLRENLAPVVVSALGIWMCVEFVALLGPSVLAPLGYVGRYSLGIMGAQLPVIATLVSLDIRSPWIVFPATMVGSLAISWLLDRSRLTRQAFLGGRRGGSVSDGADVTDSVRPAVG